jgi:hypothetical protein
MTATELMALDDALDNAERQAASWQAEAERCAALGYDWDAAKAADFAQHYREVASKVAARRETLQQNPHNLSGNP